MSDFDDAIGEMTDDLLTEAGGSFVYRRGSVSTTITLRKSSQQSFYMDAGNGQMIEVRPVDFIGKTSALPYNPPEKGDLIISGSERFEVQPTTSEKVFRRISPQLTRIHAKQVK
jgi:hypothetical protein